MSDSMLINELDAYLRKLFPLTRSLTGDGNRQTLKILKNIIPLKIREVPSGTKAYDWIIPEEWLVNDAWIKDDKGRKLVDFKENNLHLLGYSVPINRKMTFRLTNSTIRWRRYICHCRCIFIKRIVDFKIFKRQVFKF